MDERNKPSGERERPQEPPESKPDKKLSRTTLTFYIIGLFSVAIALILISYVAQSRADKQLDTLTDELSKQQEVAQGVTQKMEDLQKQLDNMNRALDGVREALGTEQAKTDVVAAAVRMAEERDVYAALAELNALLAGDDLPAARRACTALIEKYGEPRLSGTTQENAFGAGINSLFTEARRKLAFGEADAPAGETETE